MCDDPDEPLPGDHEQSRAGDIRVDVIGAGMSGILTGIRLLQAGIHNFVIEAMKHTVWVSGCRSRYLDKNGTPVTWPWSFERFIDDMRAPKLAEFEMRI